VLHRIYFSPGMFGFGRLASYDYFAHLERALGDRLRADGSDVATYVVDVAPTASLRRRAARLAETVARTCGGDDGDHGPIHLVGHSTGGLDARLVACPDVSLAVEPEMLTWLPRLRSVTLLSTPNFGTPLAKFFATVSGQRMLYALSALTFIGLTIGAPPMAVASAIVVAIGRLDRTLGIELGVLDRTTDSLLRLLDPVRRREVRAYLDAIKEDQGAVLQLTPEAMELFQAGVRDRPGVTYQSAVSMAEPPSASRFVRALGSAWGAASTAIFTTLYGLTSRADERYPCTVPYAGDETEIALVEAFGRAPGARANDGVVPLRSQIWGRVVWAGYGDHLDVLGHFRDEARGAAPVEGGHKDWLASGAGFDRRRFAQLTNAIADGMIRATRGA
jgi:triacylglycerol esterase/lipase EstA (alpha/beta hydrolase family)